MAKGGKLKLIGKIQPMRGYGVRIPPEDSSILDETAIEFNCTTADLLRSAWKEFIVNHNLAKGREAKNATNRY